MTHEWKDSVNHQYGTARISNLSKYMRTSPPTDVSPIDRFYIRRNEIIQLAKPTFLRRNPAVGPLLLVGIVSCTENYFREILATIISICPVAKSTSADQAIKLGSATWHKNRLLEKGAFEHISFADVKNIKSTCKNYIGYELRDAGRIVPALKEFEKICQMRHSIVHSDGYISGKNALKLDIRPSNSDLELEIGYDEIQECALICSTLIASFNNELFEELAKRWTLYWPSNMPWDKKIELSSFRSIWNSFFSEIDNTAGNIHNSLSSAKCKNRIKKEFSS